jgi:hypothetical protein
VAHDTPNAAATWATECPSSPTRRHASARARSVIDARGRIASLVSVHVEAAHAGSVQRQTRLTHTNVTTRPPQGRSRTPRRAPIMQPGRHPTGPAKALRGGRLDRLLHLPRLLRYRQQNEPGQPEHHRTALPSFITWGLPRLVSRHHES